MSIPITKETKAIFDDMAISIYIPLLYAQYLSRHNPNVISLDGNRIICSTKEVFDDMVEFSQAFKFAADVMDFNENGEYKLTIHTKDLGDMNLEFVTACGHNLAVLKKLEDNSRVLN